MESHCHQVPSSHICYHFGIRWNVFSHIEIWWNEIFFSTLVFSFHFQNHICFLYKSSCILCSSFYFFLKKTRGTSNHYLNLYIFYRLIIYQSFIQNFHILRSMLAIFFHFYWSWYHYLCWYLCKIKPLIFLLLLTILSLTCISYLPLETNWSKILANIS